MGVRGKVLERRSDGRNRQPQGFFYSVKTSCNFVKPAINPISSRHKMNTPTVCRMPLSKTAKPVVLKSSIPASA